MLRNLTFVVQFAYFSIRPKTFCYFEQLLSNFLRYYGKMFGKSRSHAKFWGANRYYERCANGAEGEEKIRKLLTWRFVPIFKCFEIKNVSMTSHSFFIPHFLDNFMWTMLTPVNWLHVAVIYYNVSDYNVM